MGGCPTKHDEEVYRLNLYNLSDGTACYWKTGPGPYNVVENYCSRPWFCSTARIPNEDVQCELKANSTLFSCEDELIWIGVRYDKTSGCYHDSKGNPVTWTNWAEGEPDGVNSTALPEQNCVAINSTTLQWHDRPCREYHHGLCMGPPREEYTCSTQERKTKKNRRKKNKRKNGNTTSVNNNTNMVRENRVPRSAITDFQSNVPDLVTKDSNAKNLIPFLTIAASVFVIGIIFLLLAYVFIKRRKKKSGAVVIGCESNGNQRKILNKTETT